MAIKIQLKDGMVEVGGDFQSALNFVKSFEGRNFDSATKTWSIPVSLQDFGRGCRFPYDVTSGHSNGRLASGSHVTKYGNSYSRDEWSAQVQARKAEAEISEAFGDKFFALDAELRQRAEQIQLNPKVLPAITSYNFESRLEMGSIKFATPAREVEVMALYHWYSDAKAALYEAQDDEVTTAKERIYEAAGIY
jgi:hypothetical protein